MKKKIDRQRILELVKEIPPSPRDPLITKLGYASFGVYVLAGVCAWQFGEWWGLGLVVALLAISVLDQLVHNEYREELIAMNGKLIKALFENSDVLDEEYSIPSKDN